MQRHKFYIKFSFPLKCIPILIPETIHSVISLRKDRLQYCQSLTTRGAWLIPRIYSCLRTMWFSCLLSNWKISGIYDYVTRPHWRWQEITVVGIALDISVRTFMSLINFTRMINTWLECCWLDDKWYLPWFLYLIMWPNIKPRIWWYEKQRVHNKSS
jgi:hypothetical protein